jgi:hypothetical protein
MSATLNGLSEIRSHFFRDNTPTWSICASPYTLLGMDEWVRGFRYISYADCFDGQHPRVFSPERADRDVFPFETLEEMNTALLRNPAVQAQLKARGPGRAALQLFDEDAEELCRQLDLQLVFPRAELRRRIDDKIEATRLANKAGVASVPNALGPVKSWEDLQALAGHLGPDLVIQTAFGDSGTTTYFVSSREDLDKVLPKVAAEREVKVMKKIRCFQAAVEGCVTSAGTIVGPMMTEMNPRITGASPLTNLAAFAHADAPLFLFHLLEWSGIPFTMDVARLNARWAHPVHADPWGQLIIKHTDKEPVEVMKAPTSGSWSMAEDGSIAFQHMQTHRRTVDDENSAFFLRIAEAGDIVRYGDDVGVLVVRGRLMNDQRGLTERAKAWTAGVRGAFQTRPF